MSVYKKLAGQTLVYGLGTIGTRLLNFVILTPFLTRNIPKIQYGIYTDLYAYAGVLLIILLMGLETGFFNFANKQKEKSDTIFSTAFIVVTGLSITFLLLVFGFIDNVSEFLKYQDHKIYIQYFAAFIAIDAISSILLSKVRFENRAFYFSFVNIVNVIVIISGILLFILVLPERTQNEWYLKNLNDHGKVYYIFLANLLGSGTKLILLLKEIIKIRVRFVKTIFIHLIIYSFPLLISGLGGIINETFDRIVFKFVIPDTDFALKELATYGAVYKLAVIINLFIQMFRYAAEPLFFSLSSDKNSKVVYGNVLVYFLIFCIGIFLSIMFYMDIVKYYIDEQYHVALDIVPIVLLANVFYGLLFNINFWFKLSGLTKFAMLIMGIGAVISITINIVFIPKYSYYACAYGHLASNVVMVIVSFVLGQHYYPIKYDLKKIGFYLLFAGLLFLLYKVLIFFKIYNMIIGTFLIIIFFSFAVKNENLIKLLKDGSKSSK